MVQANHQIGEVFQVQFVWQLPDTDYLRAVFQATIVGVDEKTDRYVVTLDDFLGGRQESAAGEMRPREAVNPTYWQLVLELIGRKINLAYEVDNGQAIHLRLPTLTREHKFFRKYE